MNKVLSAVIVMCVLGFAGTRTEVIKTIVKPDTSIKLDTLKTVTYDTFKVMATVKDSTIIMKLDTQKVNKPISKKAK